MTHLEHLKFYFPDILKGTILDLGSGRGSFLIEAALKGARVYGIEPNPAYINITLEKSNKAGVQVNVKEGAAESIPFEDNFFDFVNICEVIEHVKDPQKLLSEVYRVLVPGGKAYLSIPNRFGLKDPHFHLYFINWLPRSWAYFIIGLLGRHKDYSGRAGRQNILDMHYSTFSKITSLAREKGLEAQDMRRIKIRRTLPRPLSLLALPAYIAARTFYFNTFHIFLSKPRTEK